MSIIGEWSLDDERINELENKIRSLERKVKRRDNKIIELEKEIKRLKKIEQNWVKVRKRRAYLFMPMIGGSDIHG